MTKREAWLVEQLDRPSQRENKKGIFALRLCELYALVVRVGLKC